MPRAGTYHRVLLKISGEALAGAGGYGIDRQVLVGFAAQLRDVHAAGCELALVIGGGNIFRGTAGGALGIDRATGDYMGMLATVINALALQDALDSALADARYQSIGGKALTPFLLDAIRRATAGRSLEANCALLVANARLAAEVAAELAPTSPSQ